MEARNIFTAIVYAILFCSCSTIKTIPVEAVRHDSVRSNVASHDSIVIRDSINTITRGDTVFSTKYKYLYRERTRTDTLFSIRHDTITKIVRVEKELSSWQRKKMKIGECCLWAVLPLLLIFLLKGFRRYKWH